ncbi:MAG: hypothetical protein FWD71_02280 [Oscillospiraceae bacterium]|nr:hypothetical protein [Oscillospiraceae bacterium]
MVKNANEANNVKENKENPIFNIAKMRGYDIDEGKIIPYDLLDEKLLHTVWVEKISSRTKYVNPDKCLTQYKTHIIVT